MNLIKHIGAYFLMIRLVFIKPTKQSIMYGLVLKEIQDLILGSLGIVCFLSFFVGGVVSIQTALNIDSAFIPDNLVGFATRQGIILEFAPTFMSIILAGKVGSNIASQLGTMRVTEQIDALEIMGVNSAGHLVLPKVIASLTCIPFLVIISMVLGIGAGLWVGVSTGVSSAADFKYGMQIDFNSFDVTYALLKTCVFALIISSVSAYHGYFTSGGALEVGRSSTKAVVYAVVIVMVANLLLTQMLLG